MDKEQEHDSQLNDQAYDDHLNKVTDPSLLHIEPCPFCNSTKIMAEGNAQLVFIVCQKCLAQGPAIFLQSIADLSSQPDKEALKLWNTRTIIR